MLTKVDESSICPRCEGVKREPGTLGAMCTHCYGTGIELGYEAPRTRISQNPYPQSHDRYSVKY